MRVWMQNFGSIQRITSRKKSDVSWLIRYPYRRGCATGGAGGAAGRAGVGRQAERDVRRGGGAAHVHPEAAAAQRALCAAAGAERVSRTINGSGYTVLSSRGKQEPAAFDIGS